MSAQPKASDFSRRSQRQSALTAQRERRLSAASQKAADRSKISLEVSPVPTKLWESGMALGINLVLISTAIVTLTHLLPYQLTQHAKLKEIRAEESNLSQDIQTLEQSYKQNQTPDAAQRIAQQQGNLMPVGRLSVVLTQPLSTAQ
jgi:hypothetical protein